MYILSGVLCFAVGVMFAYHLYNISNGETSVESQDHDQYRRKAKSRDEVRFLSIFWAQPNCVLSGIREFVRSRVRYSYQMLRLLLMSCSAGGRKTFSSFSTLGQTDSGGKPFLLVVHR